MTRTSATTRFGAPWAEPRRTAAVLRAQASALGVTLTPTDPASLAAAVLGAHGWSSATSATNLAEARTQPAAVIQSASAVLLRAAGAADLVDVPDVTAKWCEADQVLCSDRIARLVAEAVSWVASSFPDRQVRSEVLANAADDLLVAGRHPVAGVGWLLLGEAEALHA